MHVISDFQVKDKAELNQQLDAAVTAARTLASADGVNGILVTRHDFSHFSVTLSPNVPFGFIHEDDQARRN